MFQQEFNSIINEPANIMDIALADVKGMSERYPYCQAVQVIYAKKLREINSPLFEQQLKKAAVAVYDRNVLFQYIERNIVPQFTPVTKSESEPIGVDKKEFSQVEEQIIALPEIMEKAETPKVIDEVISNPEPVMEITTITETTETIDLPIEDLFEEPVEEKAFDTPIINTDIPEEIISEDSATTNEKLVDQYIAEIPELQQTITEEAEPAEILQEMETDASEEILVPDETQLTDEFVESVITGALASANTEDNDDENMDVNNDDPIFDMPGYDIEHELGTLAEEDMIRIRIQKPIEEQVNDEVFEDSFLGWLGRLGSPSKGVLVEMKASNLPVKKYLQASPQAGIPAQESRQEKVMDEIIAGELARKSLQADDQLVTETYARILTMQGKYQKAVDMYMKLSLLKPQKSDYFAALIDQIKKRIK